MMPECRRCSYRCDLPQGTLPYPTLPHITRDRCPAVSYEIQRCRARPLAGRDIPTLVVELTVASICKCDLGMIYPDKSVDMANQQCSCADLLAEVPLIAKVGKVPYSYA